jgi:hypothetical protein
MMVDSTSQRRFFRRRAAVMLAVASLSAGGAVAAGALAATATAQAASTSSGSTTGYRGTAPMVAVGYAGVTFTATGKAIFLLQNGRSITVPGDIGAKILRVRAETGTPPIPVTGTPPPTPPSTT